jgi:hypothetical protein
MLQSPTLQEDFLATQGKPIIRDGQLVHQIDRLAIGKSALITVMLRSVEPSPDNAVILAVRDPGGISLSDGSETQLLAIWDDPQLPRRAQYQVRAIDGTLSVYNKYRTRHRPDFATEDSFTGNAGVVITAAGQGFREYGCSRGDGPFNPSALAFRIEWESKV